jgi:two-component system heavy metal sensor histidine kinase CusS
MAPRPPSLVNRLTVWYVSSLFVLVAVSSALLYWSLYHALASEESDVLKLRMQTIMTLLRREPDPLPSLRRRIAEEWPLRPSQRIYVRLVSSDGAVVIESPGIPPEVIEEVFSQVTRPYARTERVRTSSGGTFVVAATAPQASDVYPGARAPFARAEVALDIGPEEALLRSHRAWTLAALALALLLAAVLGRRLAVAGMRPLGEMAAAAQRVRSSTLHERLREESLPVELRMLARTINEMLEHLEEAFTRLGRFSADIAHELRTPVGNVRGEIEVALGKTRAPEEYTEVLGSALEELGRLSKIIDALLFLAKTEDPKLEVRREKVDLAEELATILEFFDASASDGKLRLELDASPGISLRAERTLFQRALGNVISNAIAHTPEGGLIRVVARVQGGRGVIRVEDTGNGIAPSDLPYVFDRFFRADRARYGSGFGLGLTIVKSIVNLHGGEIRISSEPGRGTRVTFELPLES